MWIALHFSLLVGAAFCAEETGPLALEAKIPLGDITGRIDHLAIDLKRRRLFVAELGNNSVGVLDLNARRLLRTMSGFDQPQGLGYSAAADELYVADGRTGIVHVLKGEALTAGGQIELGDDADNVRISDRPLRVIVGYGSGALAVFDAVSHSRKPDIRLKGHPEGFQIVPGESRALVNIPENAEIAVVDLDAAAQTASWPMPDLRANFPMAVDEVTRTAWIVTRQPARLLGLDTHTGARTAVLESCEDADDVFVDSGRHRIYVSCGAGYVDVWELRSDRYLKIAHQATAPGARTALFVPELDRFFLAVRGSPGAPAAIWVYQMK